MERVIIIGGGVAGLSCLNALADRHVQALLLEGSTIGIPKLCGEFLAPSAVEILKKWDLGPIQTIRDVSFFVKNKELSIKLPQSAGAFARDTAEYQLAQRAKIKGCTIMERTPIERIVSDTHTSSYSIYLKSGEVIKSVHIIIATGKFLSSMKPVDFPYYAIKGHLKYVVQPHSLLMNSIQGAYFGVVPISQTHSNFACLIKKDLANTLGKGHDIFAYLIEKNNLLRECLQGVDTTDISLLEGPSPEFRMARPPQWSQVYWIGDALANPPPAMGYGFAHSVNSGILAAECFLENNLKKYVRLSNRGIKPKIQLGRALHHLLLNPTSGAIMLPILKLNSWIAPFLLKHTRYSSTYN